MAGCLPHNWSNAIFFATSIVANERCGFVSVGSIADASEALVSILQAQLKNRLEPSRYDFTVRLFRSAQFTGAPTNTVSLWLYQVDINPHVLNRPIPPTPAPSGGTGLSTHNFPRVNRYLDRLELRYLLTVWGDDCARGEQEILQHCMEILHEFSTSQESPLNPCLRLSQDSLTNDEMMRLWRSFALPYQLSIPYRVWPSDAS